MYRTIIYVGRFFFFFNYNSAFTVWMTCEIFTCIRDEFSLLRKSMYTVSTARYLEYIDTRVGMRNSIEKNRTIFSLQSFSTIYTSSTTALLFGRSYNKLLLGRRVCRYTWHGHNVYRQLCVFCSSSRIEEVGRISVSVKCAVVCVYNKCHAVASTLRVFGLDEFETTAAGIVFLQPSKPV